MYGLTLGCTTAPPTKKPYVYVQSRTLGKTDNVFLDLWKFAQKMMNSAPSDCEVRAAIKFLNVEDVTGLEIYRRLRNIHGAHYNVI